MDCRRLVCYHSAVIQGSLHAITMALLPSVDALRSSTGKEALSVFQASRHAAAAYLVLAQGKGQEYFGAVQQGGCWALMCTCCLVQASSMSL